jgi:hypothetical protein
MSGLELKKYLRLTNQEMRDETLRAARKANHYAKWKKFALDVEAIVEGSSKSNVQPKSQEDSPEVVEFKRTRDTAGFHGSGEDQS